MKAKTVYVAMAFDIHIYTLYKYVHAQLRILFERKILNINLNFTWVAMNIFDR